MKYLFFMASILVFTALGFYKFRGAEDIQVISDSTKVTPVDSEKKHASAPVPADSFNKSRIISSLAKNDIQSDLRNDSSGDWQLTQDENGRILRMSGASLNLGEADPALAAHKFLRKYGKNLFGLPVESAALVAINREAENSQVIFEQVLDGLKVYGTRVNLFFDHKGSLIYAVSDTCSLSSGATASGLVDVGFAAKAARAELLKFLKMPSPGSIYPEAALAANMERALRCTGERLSSIFHVIVPLESPDFGDVEIEVDAQSGTVTKMKNLARK